MNNIYMCIKRVYNVLMHIICTFTVHDVIVCIFIQINGFTNLWDLHIWLTNCICNYIGYYSVQHSKLLYITNSWVPLLG